MLLWEIRVTSLIFDAGDLSSLYIGCVVDEYCYSAHCIARLPVVRCIHYKCVVGYLAVDISSHVDGIIREVTGCSCVIQVSVIILWIIGCSIGASLQTYKTLEFIFSRDI